MIESPKEVLATSLIISLIMFSYQLRLFERYVDPDNFGYITTAMWNVLITMTTVGYGDFYPKSHLGRMIGIVVAFWGVFYVSLFVVALNNILNFLPSEGKAYNLLQKVTYKDDLKEESAGMLVSSYRMKLLRRNKEMDLNKRIGGIIA